MRGWVDESWNMCTHAHKRTQTHTRTRTHTYTHLNTKAQLSTKGSDSPLPSLPLSPPAPSSEASSHVESVCRAHVRMWAVELCAPFPVPTDAPSWISPCASTLSPGLAVCACERARKPSRQCVASAPHIVVRVFIRTSVSSSLPPCIPAHSKCAVVGVVCMRESPVCGSVAPIPPCSLVGWLGFITMGDSETLPLCSARRILAGGGGTEGIDHLSAHMDSPVLNT